MSVVDITDELNQKIEMDRTLKYIDSLLKENESDPVICEVWNMCKKTLEGAE
jgi:hypothetical protein